MPPRAVSSSPRRRKRVSPHKALINAFRPMYERLLAKQGGVCALCGRAPSERRRLDIDHDHKRMVIRGLLCFRCNRALPSWMTREWLLKAADYVDGTVNEEDL